MIFRCEACGIVFDEPRTMHDSDSGDYEVCPICGRPEFNEVERCDVCGDLHSTDEWLCEKCAEALGDKVVEFVDGLSENEKNLLSEWLLFNTLEDIAYRRIVKNGKLICIK